MSRYKSLKDCKLFDSEYYKNVWITDSTGVKHAFQESQKSCKTVDVDELCKFALCNITKMEKAREQLPDYDREGYLLLTGKIWGLREFFNLEGDK